MWLRLLAQLLVLTFCLESMVLGSSINGRISLRGKQLEPGVGVDEPKTDTIHSPVLDKTTPKVNVSDIMFGRPRKTTEATALTTTSSPFTGKARFQEVHKDAQRDRVGGGSDPWWLNPPPWWLPPPPEWGAAPVSMYSSFYNPGTVQNPRPDRVPMAFAPYPIMT